MEAESLNRESFDWILILIILSLGGLAWIRVSFPKRLQEFATAFISNRYISQITREENPFLNLSMVVLYLNYLINMSIFIYLLNLSFELNELLNDGISSFLVLLVLLFFFDVIKLFFYWFTATVYRTEHQTSIHVLNLMLNRAGLGLAFCAVNLVMAYSALPSTNVAYIALGAIGLMFIYRLVKSLPAYLNEGNYPVHYFILYICTLEISPVLILGKYFASI